MKASIIIPCLNEEKTITHQLESLAAQKWAGSWEVVIADNGSTDGTLEIIKKYKKDKLNNIKLIDASLKKGVPYAVNTAVDAASGEFLLFCDADDQVGEGWLEAMTKALSEHEFVACRTEVEKLNTPVLQKTRANPQAEGLQDYNYPNYLSHAASCSMGMRKDVFINLGGYDESFRILHDTDLCWRAQLNDINIKFVDDALIHYRYRNTLKGMFKQSKSYGEYNVRLYKKYKELGMSELTLKRGLIEWRKLFRRWRQLLKHETRVIWVMSFGWRVGRLLGCIKYRVVAL